MIDYKKNLMTFLKMKKFEFQVIYCFYFTNFYISPWIFKQIENKTISYIYITLNI